VTEAVRNRKEIMTVFNIILKAGVRPEFYLLAYMLYILQVDEIILSSATLMKLLFFVELGNANHRTFAPRDSPYTHSRPNEMLRRMSPCLFLDARNASQLKLYTSGSAVLHLAALNLIRWSIEETHPFFGY
jgi:hypothetical protein